MESKKRDLTSILLFGEGIEGTPEERHQQFGEVIYNELHDRGMSELADAFAGIMPKAPTRTKK